MTSTTMSSVRIPVAGSTSSTAERARPGQGEIVGTVLMPPNAPIGLLIIHPATATPARFYTNFADYAVERGLGEDIPTAAMLEWGRWVRMSEYFFDDPSLGASARMARLRTPVLAIGTSDDNWIDALVDHVRLAVAERRTFTPQELEVSRIGHHGLLRRSVAGGAWPEIVSWLLQRLPQN